MVQIHESSSSKHSYPKQALGYISFFQIYFYCFLPCQSRSTSSSSCIFRTTYNIAAYWCFRRSSLDMTKPSQTMLDYLLLNLCYPKIVPNIIISDSIFPYMATYPTQHPHFSYTHLLDVLSFCTRIFCIIYHRESNRRPVELAF
jgi:hypothetical protein